MPSCSVPKCSTNEGGHRFPRDEARRKKWLTAIRRKNLRPSIHAVVCKNHFIPDDYMLPKDSVFPNPSPRLKKDAVPSVFPWNSSKPIMANNVDHVQRAIRRQRKKEQEMAIERQKEKIEREMNIARSHENENLIEAMDFVQIEMA